MITSSGYSYLRKLKREIDVRLEAVEPFTNPELQRRCQLAFSGPADSSALPSHTPAQPFLQRLIRSPLTSSPVDYYNLALGIEAFRRAPADLVAQPEEPIRLYPEQICAALGLLTECLVQMDTGEGKTYALLPAAFALACKYGRVYILCANEHLAHRDARRTQNYWAFLGVDVGLALDSYSWSSWDRPVVYTTLRDLAFKVLGDELRPSPPSEPVLYGAVILDDADTVLLDDATQSFSIVQTIDAELFDWPLAIACAESLEQDEHVTVDASTLNASLSESGEIAVRSFLREKGAEDINYLFMRDAVERAFIATQTVQEDVDYVVQDGRIVPVNRISGSLDRGVTTDWMIPLEVQKRLEVSVDTVSLHQISTVVLLRRMKHVCGLSGTIANDVLEYLYVYHRWCVGIPPRFPRDPARYLVDRVFRTQTEAIDHAVEQTKHARERGRPTLIGTQTIREAESVHDALVEGLQDSSSIHLLSGRNDSQMAKILSSAGRSGSVVVGTQVTGRGVDIVLDEDAEQSGGLCLIGIGRALERRYDSQFLGRAGRHGDKFTAQFLCSLDDSLLSNFAPPWVAAFLERMGLKGEEFIEAPMVQRAINRAQRRMRAQAFRRRLSQSYSVEGDFQAREGIRDWLAQLQAARSEHRDGVDVEVAKESSDGTEWTDEELADCPISFVSWVARRFVEQLRVGDVDAISTDQAERLARSISDQLGVRHSKCPVQPADIEGYATDVAVRKIRSLIRDRVAGAVRASMENRRSAIEADKAASRERGRRNVARAVVDFCADVRRLLDQHAEGAASVASLPAGSEQMQSPEDELRSFVDEQNRYLSERPRARVDVARRRCEEAAAKLGIDVQGRLSEDGRALCLGPAVNGALSKEIDGALQHHTIHFDHEEGPVPPSVPSDEDFTRLLAECRSGHLGSVRELATYLAACAAHPSERGSVQGLTALVDRIVEAVESGIAVVTEKLDGYEPPEPRLFWRTPRMIANRVIRHAWTGYLKECRRIHHRTWHENAGTLEHGRLVLDRTMRAWRKADGKLPGEVLGALLLSASPELLDEPFALDDHVVFVAPSTPEPIQRLEPPVATTEDSLERPDDSPSLARRFMSVPAGVAAAKVVGDARLLLRLLLEFLKQSPVRTLTGPIPIGQALNTWFYNDRARQVPLDRARDRRRVLLEFLRFLYEQGVVGHPPTARNWIGIGWTRFVRGLRDRNTLLAVTPLATLWVLVALICALPAAGVPRDLGFLMSRFDAWIFGGLLAEGGTLVPFLGALLAGPALAKLADPASKELGLGLQQDRGFSFVLLLLLSAYLAGFSFSVLDFFLSLGRFALLFFVSWTFLGGAWLIRSLGSPAPNAVWLTYTSSFVALPLLLGGQLPFAPALGLVMGVTLLTSLVWYRNQLEIPVQSALIAAVRDTRRTELVQTCYRVSGSTGVAGHVFGCAAAYAFHHGSGQYWFDSASTRSVLVPVLIYVVVTLAWSYLTIRRRLHPAAWTTQLRSRSQVFAEGNLEEVLLSVRRRLTVWDWLLQIVVLVSCVWVIGPVPVSPDGFPLPLLVAPILTVLAVSLRELAQTAHRLIMSRAPVSVHVLDLSLEYRVDEEESRSRIGRFLSARPALRFSILVALIGFLKDIIDFIRFLVGLL